MAYKVKPLKEAEGYSGVYDGVLWVVDRPNGDKEAIVNCPVPDCGRHRYMALSPRADGKRHHILHELPNGEGWIEGSILFDNPTGLCPCQLHWFINADGNTIDNLPAAPCKRNSDLQEVMEDKHPSFAERDD